MGLIQAGFLAAMVTLAIPVLIHLLSRWQVRRLEFGTMQFLQEVIHDSAHRRRLRRWLLLATRLLLVALLAILFARPFIPDRAEREGDRVRMVLIDRSASMTMPGQSGRLIDDAIAAGAEAAQRAGTDTQVQWAWFDRHIESLPKGTARPKPPRNTSGDTNYFAALSWARDRLATGPIADAELILVTDLQQSGLSSEQSGSGELSFPADVPVRVIDVGRTAANNLAITSISTGASELPPGKKLNTIATLFNYGALPAEEVPVTATASSGERSVRMKKTLSIANEQAEEIAFDFGELEAGSWQITVDIDYNDDLASDNRRYAAVNIAKPLEVLVLDPSSGDASATSPSYFLVTALKQGAVAERMESDSVKPLEFNRFATQVVFLGDGAPVISSTSAALIIVADAGTLSAQLIEQLEDYVSRGGRLLVFAGAQMSESLADHWFRLKLAPGQLSRWESATAMPFRIVSISSRGTMLDPFRDPQHGDLGRLAFSSLLKTDIHESTQVLAWFDQQRPALTEHRLGKGRIAWFLSSVDNQASNWTTSPLYLPLIQQMASDLVGITGEGPVRFRNVGDIEIANETLSSPRQSTDSTLQTPDPKSGIVTSSGNSESLYLEQPGFQVHPEALYVINTPAKESDPARIDTETFVKHFDLTPANEDAQALNNSVESQKRRELWPWIAAALVVVLVLEFCLSNRTPA